MHRLIVAMLMACTFSNSVRAAQFIAPGMQFSEAAQTLVRNGYEVDSEKFGFQVVGGDESQVLEFCRVDDGVTLVLTCDRHSERIRALHLYFSGEGPKSTRTYAVREVRKMTFDGDFYTVRLRRQRPD
jgi:hypothetical protein